MKRRRLGPTSGMPLTISPSEEASFWKRVGRASPDACWEWQGSRQGSRIDARHGNPYGKLTLSRLQRPVGAHRISYVIHYGPIPAGMCVMHTCDNPPCVNPAHLTLGTQRENIRDCVAKGRHYPGGLAECVRGHPFTPENTLHQRSGARLCRTCHEENRRDYTARRSATKHAEWHDGVLACLTPYLPTGRRDLTALMQLRDADALCMYYGLFGEQPRTLEEIGKQMGLTRERVRQLRNRALQRLGISGPDVIEPKEEQHSKVA